MDGAFQNKCFGLPDDFDCDSCHYNVGFQTGWGGVVGPWDSRIAGTPAPLVCITTAVNAMQKI